jgi:hypothetical protein
LDKRESAQSPNPVQLLTEYFRDKEISPDFRVYVGVNATRFVEQASFTIRLVEERSGGLSVDPVFAGLFSAGRRSQTIHGWVDGDFFDFVLFSDRARFSLSEFALDIELFKLLGGLVPPGGSFMVSYSLFSKEARVHRETKLGLDRGYPPVVTPLGVLLFGAGCGMSFKDWYFAEGGREGPEKLQGYKPLDSEVAKQRADSALRELRAFVQRTPPDDFARECHRRAERVISELEQMRRNL